MKKEELKYHRIQVIDIDTGEIIGNILKSKNEDIILNTKKVFTDKQKYFLNNQDGFKKYASEQGGFIQMLFTQKEKLNLGNCDKATLSRLVYLSTYIDYNNRQENLLVKRVKNYKLEPMTRKDIQNTLGLGDTAFKGFLKDVKDSGLLYEAKGKFYISDSFVTKGKNDISGNKYNDCFTRLFINNIRDLYEGCKPRGHKVLSNIFLLLPFIHINTNIITFDGDSVYDDDVNPMSIVDIGELLEIEGTNNLKRLVQDLEKIRVTIEGREYKMFTWVRMSGCDYFVINPRVVYRGNDFEQMCWIADTYFFRDNRQR